MNLKSDKAQAFISLVDNMSKAAAINILPKDYDSAILARDTAIEIADALRAIAAHNQTKEI